MRVSVLAAFLSEKFRKGKIRLVKDKKPYLRKIRTVSEIEVWLVDGEYVRKNICEDFVNFDHHYHLPLIPKNEFWIASGASPEEIRYYIDHMLAEYRLIKAGVGRDEASRKADIIERRERGKSEIMKKLRHTREHRKELIDRVHRKLLRSYGRKLKIWVVNGELVRDIFYLNFAGGGHDKVYHFIPEGEVWLDDDISAKERRFILLHELRERALMAKGKDYPHSHWKATEVEDFFRHHPKGIDKRIKEEIAKQ